QQVATLVLPLTMKSHLLNPPDLLVVVPRGPVIGAKKRKLASRLEKFYQTIDELSSEKEELEEQLENATNTISSLQNQYTQMLERTQDLESQPLI
ncbi:hypothetical protein P5E86_15205, partial [Clostridium perfringens]|nr:hypothetical protein [Clostridium perfringens]